MKTSLLFLPLLLTPSLAKIGSPCHRVKVGAGTCQKTSVCPSKGGFSIKGACPKDPNNVRCCIPARCAVDQFSGHCSSKSKTSCSGYRVKNLCPGPADIQCCVDDSTTTDIKNFIAYIRRLYNLAKAYGGRNPNQLVMEWLRHSAYNGFTWDRLVGGLDLGWIKHVEKQGIKEIKQVHDPFYGIAFNPPHLGASMDGAFRKGISKGTGWNRGDVAGWAGDVFTFYAEWRRDGGGDGHAYAMKHMLEYTPSTFGRGDMIEDVDAYDVAHNLKLMSSFNIADELEGLYMPKGYYKTRLQRFWSNRFGGSRATAIKATKNVLTDMSDAIVVAGRAKLMHGVMGWTKLEMPLQIKAKDLDRFCEGVADKFLVMVEREKRGNSS